MTATPTGTSKFLSLGTLELNEIGASITGNAFINLEGNLRFVIQLNLDANPNRTNFVLNLELNGTLEKTVYDSFYARNSNNHDHTGGQFIFEYEGATLTDYFQFQIEREANGGDVNLVSTTMDQSYIFIEKYTTIEVITNIEYP